MIVLLALPFFNQIILPVFLQAVYLLIIRFRFAIIIFLCMHHSKNLKQACGSFQFRSQLLFICV
jgi:hypothetical protein